MPRHYSGRPHVDVALTPSLLAYNTIMNLLNTTRGLASKFLPQGLSSLTAHTFGASGNLLNTTRTAMTAVEAFFAPLDVYASKPVLSISSGSVVVHLFYYVQPEAVGPGGPAISSTGALEASTVNNLGELLSEVLGHPVELRLVKLYYPYLDAYILSQWIAAEVVGTKLSIVMKRLSLMVGPVQSGGRGVLSAAVVGLKVRLGGRLTMEPARPRQTVQSATLGSFKASPTTLIDTAAYTSVNDQGAHTVRVWLAQRTLL